MATIAAAILAFAGGALLVNALTSRGSENNDYARVPADHLSVMNENITFFETRVKETQDHLSYDRLTTLYLQRLRETGNVADLTLANQSANRSLEALPDAYTGTLNLALVRIAQHEFRDALALATRARDAKPKIPEAHAIAGDAQLALGQVDAAGESYRLYLELAPGFSAFTRQAAIAEMRGNVPLAEQYWDQAIDVTRIDSPEDSAWSRVQLGNLFLLQGKRGEAKKEYETALKVQAGLPSAQFGLARVAAAEKDFSKATGIVAPLVERQPLAEYTVFLAEVQERAGKSEDAARTRALLGAISSLYAANGIRDDLTLIAFALDHGSEAERATALTDALAAYEARPSGQVADLVAWAYFRNGRSAEAREFSDRYLETGTVDPLAFFHAGMIANAQGDVQRAKDFLQRALDGHSEFSVLHAPAAAATLKSLQGR